MGEIVKIKITFHFYPLRVAFGAFGVRSSSVDCDRSGRPFGAPLVSGKRPLLLLHFYTIFFVHLIPWLSLLKITGVLARNGGENGTIIIVVLAVCRS